jgi:hypothetical protein
MLIKRMDFCNFSIYIYRYDYTGRKQSLMNTRFFKYAIKIERTRSITRAAENLYMAQPNLSKAVKELEYTVGFSIFERTTKGQLYCRRVYPLCLGG